MKSTTSAGMVVVLVLIATMASAASYTFVSKELAASGQFNYTYKYSCSSRAEGFISVVAKTDEDAQKLAAAKARRVCEE